MNVVRLITQVPESVLITMYSFAVPFRQVVKRAFRN